MSINCVNALVNMIILLLDHDFIELSNIFSLLYSLYCTSRICMLISFDLDSTDYCNLIHRSNRIVLIEGCIYMSVILTKSGLNCGPYSIATL